MKSLKRMILAFAAIILTSTAYAIAGIDTDLFFGNTRENTVIVPIKNVNDTLIYVTAYTTNWGFSMSTVNAKSTNRYKVDETKWYKRGGCWYDANDDNESSRLIRNVHASLVDSMLNSGFSIDDIVDIANSCHYERLCKSAPYGYYDFEWDTNSCNGVDITFNYTNTNKKTIKYVDFWYAVYNDVNDRCAITLGSNHGKCVGPVEAGETGEWNWEALGYTTGDASVLKITKIQITYMDGTKTVLIKNMKRL